VKCKLDAHPHPHTHSPTHPPRHQVTRISAIIARYKGATSLEVQARSCEYGRLFGHEALRPQLLERMPALEESEYSRNLATDTTPSGAGGAGVCVWPRGGGGGVKGLWAGG
jgi:AP-1 complex subunit gamma-1